MPARHVLFDDRTEFGARFTVSPGAASRQLDEAIIEALPVFQGQDRRLLGRNDRLDRHVNAVAEGDENRDPPEPSEHEARSRLRGQKAASPLHRRIGVAEIGGIENRNAEQFQPGVGVSDVPGFLVVDNRAGFQLPQWWPVRVLLADLAG